MPSRSASPWKLTSRRRWLRSCFRSIGAGVCSVAIRVILSLLSVGTPAPPADRRNDRVTLDPKQYRTGAPKLSTVRLTEQTERPSVDAAGADAMLFWMRAAGGAR